jgi:hypothetical protein
VAATTPTREAIVIKILPILNQSGFEISIWKVLATQRIA